MTDKAALHRELGAESGVVQDGCRAVDSQRSLKPGTKKIIPTPGLAGMFRIVSIRLLPGRSGMSSVYGSWLKWLRRHPDEPPSKPGMHFPVGPAVDPSAEARPRMGERHA